MVDKKIIGIAILVGIVVFSVISINVIPQKEETMSAQASQLINQYKRRADLVPQLVKVVQGVAAYEKQTLLEVVKARTNVEKLHPSAEDLKNKDTQKSFIEAQNHLGQSLGKLMFLVEKYPELKANESFLTLQSQIEGNENRISVARRDYIDSVRDYNVTLRTFPGVLWNKIFYGKQTVENYTESADVKAVPQISFGESK